MSLTKDSHRNSAVAGRRPEENHPSASLSWVLFRGNDHKLLPVGSRAPEFRLPDETGREIALADFRGRSGVVLVFYVMDATPG